MSDTENRHHYLFVGNPGTGKSTLINGLIGKPLFKSGVSVDGSGVTFQFDKKEVPGVGVFMDTPGLADLEKKKDAAAAITTALKQNGFYRIFFVLVQDAGRIRAQDVTTMKLILDAAPTITDYSVIVNKVSEKWLGKLNRDPSTRKEWIATLMSGLPTLTASVGFMLRDSALDDEDDVEYTAPDEIIAFIQRAPGMEIKSTDVSEINPDEFEKLQAEQEELIRKLEESKEKMQQAMDEQAAEMNSKIEKLEESRRKEAEFLQKKIAEAEEIAKQEKEARQAEEVLAKQQREADAAQRKKEAEESKQKLKELQDKIAEAETKAKQEKKEKEADAAKRKKEAEDSKQKLKDLQDKIAEAETKAKQEKKEKDADAAKRKKEAEESRQKLKDLQDKIAKEQEAEAEAAKRKEKEKEKEDARNSTWVVTSYIFCVCQGETYVEKTRKEAEAIYDALPQIGFACALFDPRGNIIKHKGWGNYEDIFRRSFAATRAAS